MTKSSLELVLNRVKLTVPKKLALFGLHGLRILHVWIRWHITGEGATYQRRSSDISGCTLITRLSHAPWLKYLRQNTYAMHVSQSWSSCLQFFRDSVWYRLMVTAQVFLYLWTNTTLMALKKDIVSYWAVVDSQETSSYESDLLLSPTVSLSSDNCSHHTLHNGTKDGRRWVGRTPWVTAWRLT